MATCLVPCIQKIPNEMPIKWLIMTVSKYICICFSLEKMKAVNEGREGPDYCNHINKCGNSVLFVVWKIWCYFRKYIISKSVTNERLGHLIYKITIMHIRSAFLKTCTRKVKVGAMGVNWGLLPSFGSLHMWLPFATLAVCPTGHPWESVCLTQYQQPE